MVIVNRHIFIRVRESLMGHTSPLDDDYPCMNAYSCTLMYTLPKRNEFPPPSRPPPKLPKISVVNKSQNEEEEFELRSQVEEIYQYWSVCL